MSGKRYPEEFKTEAVKQVVEHLTVRCSGRDPPSPERAETGYRRTGHIKKLSMGETPS